MERNATEPADLACALHAEVRVSDVSRYGNVDSGFIRLQGPLQGLLVFMDDPRGAPEEPFRMLKHIGSKNELMIHDNGVRVDMTAQGLNWDDTTEAGISSMENGWIYFMPVKTKHIGLLESQEICEGVLLKLTGSQRRQYQRVGLLSVDRDILNDMQVIREVKGKLPAECYLDTVVIEDVVSYVIEII